MGCEANETQHPRPLDREHYAAARMRLQEAEPTSELVLADFEGQAIELEAGSALTVELIDGPQVVHLFCVNRDDPDERYWAHETCLIEGLFLTRCSRMWGTMARFRPLLTFLEDTVQDQAGPGAAGGKHHPAYGGAGTPRAWRQAGGSQGTATVWEQFAALFRARGLPVESIKDEACLFQKTRIDPLARRLEVLPPDCIAGDRVGLFAEQDLVVFLALSPHVDGTRPAAEAPSEPNPVRIATAEGIAEPLPWPYPGMPYPDLSLYLDGSGSRSTDIDPTPPRR